MNWLLRKILRKKKLSELDELVAQGLIEKIPPGEREFVGLLKQEYRMLKQAKKMAKKRKVRYIA